jgi:hypothetical protein
MIRRTVAQPEPVAPNESVLELPQVPPKQLAALEREVAEAKGAVKKVYRRKGELTADLARLDGLVTEAGARGDLAEAERLVTEALRTEKVLAAMPAAGAGAMQRLRAAVRPLALAKLPAAREAAALLLAEVEAAAGHLRDLDARLAEAESDYSRLLSDAADFADRRELPPFPSMTADTGRLLLVIRRPELFRLRTG